MKQLILSDKEFKFLVDLIKKRSGSVDPLSSKITNDYPRAQKEIIKNILTDELVESGLGHDDEPNEYGKFLEELNDKFPLG